MKYRDLHIQTQREFPNNARTAGFGWLVRASYLTRENELTPLGEHTIKHLDALAHSSGVDFLSMLAIPVIHHQGEVFTPMDSAPDELIHCPACTYSARRESALFQKVALPAEEPLPIERVHTPGCHTIDSLADYLQIPATRTAKAMMFTQVPSGKFVFVVLRGDMTLSETKLRREVGEIRLASAEEIEKTGGVGGFASPVGLEDALIVVDDLIPQSANLVAGANEEDYHLLNTNCGRDYQPQMVADLALAGANDLCAMCGGPLEILNCLLLKDAHGYLFKNVLLALAESHHDDRGLTLPRTASPFDAYLMHVPGKTMNTLDKANAIHQSLVQAGLRVLFDDREERAGVKFNDADLIGCPLRITVGERGLENGTVELKARESGENMNIRLGELPDHIKNTIAS